MAWIQALETRWRMSRTAFMASGTVACFVLVNVLAARWTTELVLIREQTLYRRDRSLQDAFATGRQESIRYDWSSGEEIAKYWSAIPDPRRQRVVILMGMSQNLAINDKEAGDQTLVEWVDDTLAPRGRRAFGLSAPNLCNEEAFLTTLALSIDESRRPAGLVYGVCFDKFRNVDLRPGYRDLLRERPGLRAAWERLARENAARYPEAAAKMLQSLTFLDDESRKRERTLEERLVQRAETLLPIVRARGEINGQAQMLLYELRNCVFRIKTSSKRPMLASRYRLNQQFLEMLVRAGRASGIEVALYNVPLNPQAQNPYVPAEYAEFKRWILEFAAREGLRYADLEGAVPAEEWGLLLNQPDFKHFREAGHRRTAAAIVASFPEVLLGPASIR